MCNASISVHSEIMAQETPTPPERAAGRENGVGWWSLALDCQTHGCWDAACCWLCSGKLLLSLSWELGWGFLLPHSGLVVQSKVPPTKCPCFGSSCESLSPTNPFTVPQSTWSPEKGQVGVRTLPAAPPCAGKGRGGCPNTSQSLVHPVPVVWDCHVLKPAGPHTRLACR